jgi:hypothetical protein
MLAAQAGIADVSDVAVLKRIRGSADWLKALCGEQMRRRQTCAADAPDAPAPGTARAVRIVDSSLIDGPGGVKWRLHACYDPVAQRLTAAAFTQAGIGERLDRLAIRPSEIVLADRGYPQPDSLSRTIGNHADPLVRVTWNSVTLTDTAARPLDWMALCEQAHAQGGLGMAVLFPPEAGLTRQKSLWRRIVLMHEALLQAIRPSVTIATARAILERHRQLWEPPRRRRYQSARVLC